MKRKPFLIPLAFILLLILSSCATAPPRQAALQGESVLDAIRDITKAYERRDLDAVMERLSIDYPDRGGFQKTVASVFSTYRTIRFTVHYTRMLIALEYQGNIEATFTWEGEWQTSGGRTVKDGARVTFVYDPGTFKLLAIEGKNPFIPQPGEAPGKE